MKLFDPEKIREDQKAQRQNTKGTKPSVLFVFRVCASCGPFPFP
jgi:hypothetical protein